MITVIVEIEIEHPSKDTFAFISNFENNPVWQKGMEQCRFITEGPLAVGSRYEQQAKFLGKDVLSVFEVEAYEPGKMVKASTIKSSFPITFTRIVEGDHRVSRIKAIIEGNTTGFFKIAQPLLKAMVSRTIHKDYQRLKAYLENKSEAA